MYRPPAPDPSFGTSTTSVITSAGSARACHRLRGATGHGRGGPEEWRAGGGGAYVTAPSGVTAGRGLPRRSHLRVAGGWGGATGRVAVPLRGGARAASGGAGWRGWWQGAAGEGGGRRGKLVPD